MKLSGCLNPSLRKSVLKMLHEKGLPDFSQINATRARELRNAVNELMGVYRDLPEEKTLEKIWKSLSTACVEKVDEDDSSLTTFATALQTNRSRKKKLIKPKRIVT